MKSAVAQVAYNFYILGLPYHLPDPVLHLQAKQPPASRASGSAKWISRVEDHPIRSMKSGTTIVYRCFHSKDDFANPV